MPLNGVEIPQLILVQSFGLTFLVIDFNGPAMASDASDAVGLPEQTVTGVESWIVREVSLGVIDHQALFAKAMNLVGLAITIVNLFLAFEVHGVFLEHRLSTDLDSCQVFFFQAFGELTQSDLTGLQVDLICFRQGANIGHVQCFINKVTESRLGKPAVKCHWQV